MDNRVLNQREWPGIVGMALGSLMYTDMTSDLDNSAYFSGCIDHLYNAIMRKIGVPVSEANNVAAAHPSAAIVASSSPLVDWMIGVGISKSRVVAYDRLLDEDGVSSVDRLRKKLTSNPNYLRAVGFTDPDDISELMGAIRIDGKRDTPPLYIKVNELTQ